MYGTQNLSNNDSKLYSRALRLMSLVSCLQCLALSTSSGTGTAVSSRNSPQKGSLQAVLNNFCSEEKQKLYTEAQHLVLL
jgi:hypothetical protein